MFKGRPGEKRIARNEYEVTEDSEGTLIEDSDWEFKVLPGARIVVGIILKTMLVTRKSEQTTHKCPRCNISNYGATPEKGSLGWYVL